MRGEPDLQGTLRILRLLRYLRVCFSKTLLIASESGVGIGTGRSNGRLGARDDRHHQQRVESPALQSQRNLVQIR